MFIPRAFGIVWCVFRIKNASGAGNGMRTVRFIVRLFVFLSGARGNSASLTKVKLSILALLAGGRCRWAPQPGCNYPNIEGTALTPRRRCRGHSGEVVFNTRTITVPAPLRSTGRMTRYRPAPGSTSRSVFPHRDLRPTPHAAGSDCRTPAPPGASPQT